MNEKKIENAQYSETGYSYTLSLIAGKYKPVILYCLMEYEPVRFNEMQRYIGHVADKTLSQQLKELERDGLIHRQMYPEIPPKVEYTLTPRGHSLMNVLDQLCTWGNENRTADNQRE
jgi:DNA-binding HxlR family transcriptional regulator